MRQTAPGVQIPQRKPIGKAQEILTRNRHHEVPSTLQSWEPREIVGSLRAGRSVEQTRKEFNCTAAVTLELWCRDIERRLAVVMRPMAMAAYLLAALCTMDAWEYTCHDDGAAIQRAFRTRRGSRRRRGLEDELAEVTDHARAECRIEAPGLGIGRAA